LHPSDPGFTENTEINTLRYLGKLEDKQLRYDGIFFNDKLQANVSAVVNNEPLKIKEENRSQLELPMPFDPVKINEDYELALVFKPETDPKSIEKLVDYKEKKLLADGYELFVSDHFGVMTTFEFISRDGGSRLKKTKKRRKYNNRHKSRRR
jgi:hypothetical protein